MRDSRPASSSVVSRSCPGNRPAGLSHPLATVLAMLAWMFLGLTSPLPAADSPLALEYKVKAGYLFNFAKYIEWPAATMPTTNSPIIIGIMDSTEAVSVLQKQLQGKEVQGRPLRLEIINSATSATNCHILFVSRSANQSAATVRQSLGGSATLLVGETERFAERGGTIGFVREEENFRVHLNLKAATEAGLKVSARLSSVAKMVKSD